MYPDLICLHSVTKLCVFVCRRYVRPPDPSEELEEEEDDDEEQLYRPLTNGISDGNVTCKATTTTFIHIVLNKMITEGRKTQMCFFNQVKSNFIYIALFIHRKNSKQFKVINEK